VWLCCGLLVCMSKLCFRIDVVNALIVDVLLLCDDVELLWLLEVVFVGM